ncbi:tRNA glutamyl-Q(34) synthetase GluQRS [Propionibacterium australiense]|nr:tRNA glutamyl-Q(34) synthetase GluQRS [Propionibacterium australiense]
MVNDSSHRGAGRFAPSPTCDLHLGNLRTALLAWLFARADGLNFIVRIEDLDRARVAAAPGVADQQLRDLEAIGLDWDGPVVRQSERLDLYRDATAGLDGYECFCTRREIAEASSAPHAGQRPYPGTCANLNEAERRIRRARRPAALRVRAGGAVQRVADRFAGTVTGQVDDFVLWRNDGAPAYNLAVVVDDMAQGITQVTRGADLLASAPRQAWLTERLGGRAPQYAHVGLVVNARGERLAKRDGAVTLTELVASGTSARQVFWLLCDSCALPRADCPRALLGMLADDAGALTDPALAQPWVAPVPVAP